MERKGDARTESQNCLKTSWTLFYTYILRDIYVSITYRYKQVIAASSRLESVKLASEETSMAGMTDCQRHRKPSRA